jgi:hypothetical protein
MVGVFREFEMGECRAGKRRLAKYKYCSWANKKV